MMEWPKCDWCFQSLGNFDTYMEIGGERICERCVKNHMKSTDDLVLEEEE